MATFIGTAIDDFQHSGWDRLYGNGGNDHLASDQPGKGFIYGGSGSDILYVSNPTAVGHIEGGNGNDAIFGHFLNDKLYGGNGDDLVVGSDFLWPGRPGGPVAPRDVTSGNDYLNGGAGTDAIYGFDGNDVIFGGTGNDRSSVIVLPGFDTWTDGGPLAVQAGLYGGKGNDKIYGQAGNDHIYGGFGKDVLFGGSGADLFVFEWQNETRRGINRDVIRDFSRAEHDRVDLYWMDADTTRSGNEEFGFIGDGRFNKRPGELRFDNQIVSGDTNGDGRADFEITVTGVTTLQVGDFFL